MSRSFPRSLLSIVYYPYLSLPLSSVDYYFICIFDSYLVHVPDFLKLLEFTVFHRCGDKPWKGTWEAFSHRCGYKHHRRCGYRCELSATLGRGEGTEIENRCHWPMIQSICLFSETSIRIHECGHSESVWGGNTRRWCEGPVFSRTWMLPTPPLPLSPAPLTHLAVPRFILYDNMRSLWEWSSWVWSSDLLHYWTPSWGKGTSQF